MSESDADPSVPCGGGGRQQFISHRSRWLVVLLQFLSCLSSTLSTTDINGTCGQVECLCSRKWGSGSSANCSCFKINLPEDSELSLFIWWPIGCLVYLIRTDLSNELGRLFSSSTLWGLRSRDEEVNFNLVVYLFLSLPHRPPTLRESLASGFVFQTTVALISLIQRLFLNESLMGRSNGFPGGWWSWRPGAPSPRCPSWWPILLQRHFEGTGTVDWVIN